MASPRIRQPTAQQETLAASWGWTYGPPWNVSSTAPPWSTRSTKP